MVAVVTTVCIALSLGLAAWALVDAVRDRRLGAYHVLGVAVVEAALVIQALVAAVLLIMGHRPLELGIFLTYLMITLLVPPIGLVWGLAEKSRWGNLVLVIAVVTVPVLVVRLQQLWDVTSG